MKDVYLRAAKLCFSKPGFPSCWAISHAEGSKKWENSKEKREYIDLMLNGEVYAGALWGNAGEEDMCRPLLLLFMHWISKDEK